MAAASNSEDSPTLPRSTSSSQSGLFDKSTSRSPSLSSIKEFQWSTLLVSARHGTNRKMRPQKGTCMCC